MVNGEWFTRHYKNKIRQIKRLLLLKVIGWMIEENPSYWELVNIYHDVETDREPTSFLERYKLTNKI